MMSVLLLKSIILEIFVHVFGSRWVIIDSYVKIKLTNPHIGRFGFGLFLLDFGYLYKSRCFLTHQERGE